MRPNKRSLGDEFEFTTGGESEGGDKRACTDGSSEIGMDRVGV